jgi:hypothetical protein
VVQAGGSYVSTTSDITTDTARTVDVDSTGNAYVAGYFRDTIDFNGDGVAELTSAGDTDGYVAKYAPDGSFLWATRFGGASTVTGISTSDAVCGVTEAPDGSVYASGVFVGTAEFGGPSLSLTSAGSFDNFVSRLDPDTGAVIWAKGFGGSGYDESQGALVAGAGSVFVAGDFERTASIGSFTLTAANNGVDAFFARLDPATGDAVWARRMGGTSQDPVYSLALDDAGDLFATGGFFGTGDFGGVSLTSYGSEDTFVVRLNAGDGSGVWGVHMGAADTGWNDEGRALCTDTLGNIYLTGLFNHTATFGSFTLSATGSDPRNAFATKISPTGTVLWANQLGSPTDFGIGTGIAVDSTTTSIYVTGHLGSAQLARLDLAGNIEWSRALGDTQLSFGRDVALDTSGVPYVVGHFLDPTIFDTGSANVPLTSRGGTDVYLLRYNPFGPGVRVLPASGLVTTESGGTASFNVVLNTQPTADVTFPITSSDTTEGTVSTTSVTFTPDNWNVPQTVTVTGVDDMLSDGDVAYAIVLGVITSTDPAYSGLNPADVSVTNIDNDTKFYVVNDGSPDRTYEYGASGNPVENYALNTGDTAPRGAASTISGDRVWVVDANKTVYIYNTSGGLLGSWTAGGLASNATVEGIATDGTDIWIVDARQDKVYRYAGGASRLSGSQNAASNFALNSGNTSPKDVVTDGTNLWVVNDASTDKVFKYTMAGSLVGSWTMTGAGSSPTGITLDPSGGGQLWVVDSGTDRVYQFDDARGRISGSQASSTSFALAAGNTNPQGIADPPVGAAPASAERRLDLLGLALHKRNWMPPSLAVSAAPPTGLRIPVDSEALTEFAIELARDHTRTSRSLTTRSHVPEMA